MINIISKKLEIDMELKKKIEFICDFCNTTPTFINGNIRNVERYKLSYIKPHIIIFKGFNYSKTLYIISNVIEIKELESFIKSYK